MLALKNADCFLLPVLLMAQAPAPKPQAAKPKPAARSAAAKPAAAKAKPRPAAAPALTTDDEKTIYSLGLSISRSLSRFELSPKEIALVQRGIADGAAGKPAVEFNEWGPKIDALARARAARVTEREKTASKAYLEKAAAEPGAVRTDSGSSTSRRRRAPVHAEADRHGQGPLPRHARSTEPSSTAPTSATSRPSSR